MPDFTRPGYQSYVALCRSLRLDRELQPGDPILYGNSRLEIERGGPSELIGVWTEGDHPRTDYDLIWLPQLADWLEMLAPMTSLTMTPMGDGRMGVCWRSGYGESRKLHFAYGPTREEAVARLAIAVGAVKAP